MDDMFRTKDERFRSYSVDVLWHAVAGKALVESKQRRARVLEVFSKARKAKNLTAPVGERFFTLRSLS
ncbi:MAG TPA: hypothetical protein VGX03_21165 [Candidatus Binatia bacterium]|jgi:hypothetical protein|nr:hypothetical protein [Candidatus Binatia bacterium]